MKAFADFRMTMIRERQGALRSDAARARLISRPTDGFAVDDALMPAAPAPAPARGPLTIPSAATASGGHAKTSSGDGCREGAVAA